MDPEGPKPRKCICKAVCPVDHEAEVALAFKENTVEDFERLRQKCLQEGRLYEDPDFPAQNSSMIRSFEDPEGFIPEGFIPEDYINQMKWKRPKDICENPKFFSEGPTRFDVVQGRIGNCWFIASAAILACHNEILHQVLPKGQCFKDNYAGIFHFRFWQYGRWVTVIVDDRLPTIDFSPENRNKLIFMKSSQDNEFWSALLEKAYAKLHGSYKALVGGMTGTGLEDLTGGLAEYFRRDNFKNKELFRLMLQAQKRGSLMGCSTDFKSEDAQTKHGIYGQHAHSITNVKYIKIETCQGIEKKCMIRVRNPHGMGEWTGAWRDEGSEWHNVSEEVKEKLDLKVRDDGEYWMEIKDFCKHFDAVEFTHLNKAVDIDPFSEIKWEMSQFHGSWEEGVSAGGCIEFAGTFHTNPQYRLTLHEYDDVDEDDDDDDDDNIEDSKAYGGHKCTVIISLMQKHRRKMGGHNLPFGFSIFKISDPENTAASFDASFFEEAQRVDRAPFSGLRTYTKRFQLPPGNYCVVPAMAMSGEYEFLGEFFLRIYTEKHHTANEQEKIACY